MVVLYDRCLCVVKVGLGRPTDLLGIRLGCRYSETIFNFVMIGEGTWKRSASPQGHRQQHGDEGRLERLGHCPTKVLVYGQAGKRVVMR